MSLTPEQVYQAARPILQGDRDPEGWKALLKVLDDPAADTPHFRKEFEPAILASLDRDWQDGARVVSADHSARVRKYARIYSVVETGRHYGTYFKKTIKTLAIDISEGVEDGHYSGLYLYRVSGLPNLMLEELLASGKVGPLEIFHADEVSQSDTYSRYKGPEDQIAAMIDMLLDRDAANLRSFGGSEPMGLADAVLDSFLSRRDELTALESVTFTADDLFARLDELAPLELRELNMTDYYTLEQLDELFIHPATAHLERMKCLLHEGEGDFVRWFEKGLAPSIKEWCVVDTYDYMHAALYFDTARAMYWRERLEGKAQNLLQARVVCMPDVDAETTRAHLFDGDSLKPSAELEALSVGELDDDDAIALLEQARGAWPNLKTLYLSNTFGHGSDLWDYVNECELLDHLDFFEWGEFTTFDFDEASEDFGRASSSMAEYREEVTPYLDEILEGRWRPILAARIAFWIVDQTSALPKAQALAKLVGVAFDASDETRDIVEKVREHLLGLIAPDGLRPSPFIRSSPDQGGLGRYGPMG